MSVRARQREKRFPTLSREGYDAYLQALLDSGFTADEIRRMASENARALLEV